MNPEIPLLPRPPNNPFVELYEALLYARRVQWVTSPNTMQYDYDTPEEAAAEDLVIICCGNMPSEET